MGEICTTLYFSRSGAKSLKWLVIGASTLIVDHDPDKGDER
jgi:hypothetical protein